MYAAISLWISLTLRTGVGTSLNNFKRDIVDFYIDTNRVRMVKWTLDFMFNRPRSVELIDIVLFST